MECSLLQKLLPCPPPGFLKSCPLDIKNFQTFCTFLNLADHTPFDGKINELYSFWSACFYADVERPELLGKEVLRDLLWPPSAPVSFWSQQ